MKLSRNIGLRFKILLLIVPVVLCSFTFSSIVAFNTTYLNSASLSYQIMKFKLDQLAKYASGQWSNLIDSGFFEEEEYRQIVINNISEYAEDMITNQSELIIVFDSKDKLIFSTNSAVNPVEYDRDSNSIPDTFYSSNLYNYNINNTDYIGLAKTIEGLNWYILSLEDKADFIDLFRRPALMQITTYIIALTLIIICLILAVRMFIDPVDRIRTSIENIIENRDFSNTVKIEHPDELGLLALDFNELTVNIDLAYKKLRKSAILEATAKKEASIREFETLSMLGRASDYRDSETGKHIKRVSEYSVVIADGLKMNEAFKDLLYQSSPLHDIGKLAIPDSILLKPGKLTSAEFEKIKEHASIGYELLNNSSSQYLKAGAIIAYSHHERWDGKGYPRGLKHEHIPIFGRIVSVVDVFDALTSERPYKKAISFADSIDIIKEDSGTRFDPAVIAAFMANIEKMKLILDENR